MSAWLQISQSAWLQIEQYESQSVVHELRGPRAASALFKIDQRKPSGTKTQTTVGTDILQGGMQVELADFPSMVVD
jgi:hypothetical protein